MVQIILVSILFLLASIWLGRKLYLSIKGKDAGCEHCAVNQVSRKKIMFSKSVVRSIKK